MSESKRGYFGIGVYHPKTESNIGLLWRSAHNFGAAFIFTVGHRYRHQPTDTTKAALSIPLYGYPTLDDLQVPSDCLLIGVEQSETSIDIRHVAHPLRAIYILGAEDYGLPVEVLARCNRVINIPSTHCLNVGVAGSIVMYDRLVRGTSEFRYQPERVVQYVRK